MSESLEDRVEQTEEIDVTEMEVSGSRKGVPLSILMNIPYINYLTPIWALLGGLFLIHNYITFNRQKPSFARSLYMVFKYTLYRGLSCSVLSLFLLLLGYYPLMRSMYTAFDFLYENVYVYLFGYSYFLEMIINIFGNSLNRSFFSAGILMLSIFAVIGISSLLGALAGFLFLSEKTREEEAVDEEIFFEEEDEENSGFRLKKSLRRNY